MSYTVCVYASSSQKIAPTYLDAAAAFGALLAEAGHSLVYGGGKTGLMGAVARGVHAGGGRVIGVIPEALLAQGYPEADEFIVTKDLRERKAIMEARADAFVGLPGGFGTLEEVLEIITLKQLGFHDKAIVLLNTARFYDRLIGVFEHLYAEQFAAPDFRAVYHITPAPVEALNYLAAYTPPVLPAKWTPEDGEARKSRD